MSASFSRLLLTHYLELAIVKGRHTVRTLVQLSRCFSPDRRFLPTIWSLKRIPLKSHPISFQAALMNVRSMAERVNWARNVFQKLQLGSANSTGVPFSKIFVRCFGRVTLKSTYFLHIRNYFTASNRKTGTVWHELFRDELLRPKMFLEHMQIGRSCQLWKPQAGFFNLIWIFTQFKVEHDVKRCQGFFGRPWKHSNHPRRAPEFSKMQENKHAASLRVSNAEISIIEVSTAAFFCSRKSSSDDRSNDQFIVFPRQHRS